MTVYLALNGMRGLPYFPIQTVLGVGVVDHICIEQMLACLDSGLEYEICKYKPVFLFF